MLRILWAKQPCWGASISRTPKAVCSLFQSLFTSRQISKPHPPSCAHPYNSQLKKWDLALRSPGGGVSTKAPQIWKYEEIRKLQDPPCRVGPRKHDEGAERLRKWSYSGLFRCFLHLLLGPYQDCGNFLVSFVYFKVWGLCITLNHPVAGRSQSLHLVSTDSRAANINSNDLKKQK